MAKTTRKAVLEHFAALYGEELKPHHPQRSWGAQNDKYTVLFAYTKDAHPEAPELIKVLDVDPDEMSWSEHEREQHVNSILNENTFGIVVLMEPEDPDAHPIRTKRFTEFFEVEGTKLAHGRVFMTGKRQALPEHLTL
jgi:hypothetical protein